METNAPGRSIRYPTHELAQLEVYGKVGKYSAHMKNISRTGAFFEMYNHVTQLRIGDVIQIKISLNQLNKEHFMNAEVIWKKNANIGVQFINSNKVFDRLKK